MKPRTTWFLKALDALVRVIGVSLAPEFEGNPPWYEKRLHLPSTKPEVSFHVNKKTFEIFIKQN
jgi:hypothetical protein